MTRKKNPVDAQVDRLVKSAERKFFGAYSGPGPTPGGKRNAFGDKIVAWTKSKTPGKRGRAMTYELESGETMSNAKYQQRRRFEKSGQIISKEKFAAQNKRRAETLGPDMRLPVADDGALETIWVAPSTAYERSMIGVYWNAVETYLNTGRSNSLKAFAGAGIHDMLDGMRKRPFITNLSLIKANSVQLSCEPFYRERSERAA